VIREIRSYYYWSTFIVESQNFAQVGWKLLDDQAGGHVSHWHDGRPTLRDMRAGLFRSPMCMFVLLDRRESE
jgi:hypothetical protein